MKLHEQVIPSCHQTLNMSSKHKHHLSICGNNFSKGAADCVYLQKPIIYRLKKKLTVEDLAWAVFKAWEIGLWQHSVQLGQARAGKTGKMEEIKPRDRFGSLLMTAHYLRRKENFLRVTQCHKNEGGLIDRWVTNWRKTRTLIVLVNAGSPGAVWTAWLFFVRASLKFLYSTGGMGTIHWLIFDVVIMAAGLEVRVLLNLMQVLH